MRRPPRPHPTAAPRATRALAAAAACAVACAVACATATAALADPAASTGDDDRPAPRVELWTIGTGEDLYARFGHTALRVVEPGWSDRVYNYGTTDFSRPDLVQAFLSGEAEFWLGVSSGARSERVYRRVDRTVTVTALRLPTDRAEALARRLAAEAADRDASTYRYDHFLDNCATRARDRLDEATGGALRAAASAMAAGPSYRELARRGFADLPWLLLGLDLLLGRPADRVPDPWEACFLPDALRRAVEATALGWPDGSERPLAGETAVLYARTGPPVADADPRIPRRWAWIAVAALALATAGRARWRRPAGRPAGLAIAGVGLVCGSAAAAAWTVATISVQEPARINETLLWAWPLDLALLVPAGAVLLGRLAPAGRLRRWTTVYARLRLSVFALAALGGGVGLLVQPQLHLLAAWAAGWALVAVVLARAGARQRG